MSNVERTVYTQLGVRPVINAAGSKTVLGGSRVSPEVQAVSAAANRHYVVMEELQRQSGAAVARLVHADKALVTPGCAAAMTLGVAGLMTRNDPARIAQLPDTTGLRDEIVIQKCQRYSYDRALTLCGAKLVEVGDADGASVAEVKAALTDKTVAIHYLAVEHPRSSLPFETLRDLAHGQGAAILVDAASVVYPLDDMTFYNRAGADLVCYGAKYFGGYNGTGVLCGKADLVDAAVSHSFISFETRQNRAFGRPFKLDRQDIAGVVTALTQWFAMDHEERLADLERKGQILLHALRGAASIQAEWAPSANTINHAVRIRLDAEALGRSARAVEAELMAGEPAIASVVAADDELILIVNQLYEGEAEIVGQRLRAILAR